MKKNTLLLASISLVLLFVMFHTISEAQINKRSKDHLGFFVSFGTRSNKITSNHTAINNMKLMEEGGSAGLLWGNHMIETKLSIGYYYSASRAAHTVDLINVESAIQFYPLSAITGKTHVVEPYLTTGLSANTYKFYGFYASNEPAPNYSLSMEPYLGNVNSYLGSVGAGLTINLLNEGNFVKLFTEVNYNTVLLQKSSDLFKNTQVSNQLNVNVGVSFGINRF